MNFHPVLTHAINAQMRVTDALAPAFVNNIHPIWRPVCESMLTAQRFVVPQQEQWRVQVWWHTSFAKVVHAFAKYAQTNP